MGLNPSKCYSADRSVYFVSTRFNTTEFHVLPTKVKSVFCTDLRTDSHLYHITQMNVLLRGDNYVFRDN